jgi:AcrR family transcriptional regulator
MREQTAALSGRRGQAAHNDEAILAAARDVFLADPKAPISAVADRAGVGISALYRRYAGKDDLLRTLCMDGLTSFVTLAEAAAGEADSWAAFTGFLRAVVDADVHALTVKLAGTFTPTPEMRQLAGRSTEVTDALVQRAQADGRLRADLVTEDIGLLLEGCSAIRVPDPGRTTELRRRHLAIMLAGLASGGAARPGPALPGPALPGPALPGPPPRADELSWRWKQRV